MGNFHQFIPSPTRSYIELGPLTIHFYAIAILSGIVLAIYWGNLRFVSAGGAPGKVSEVALVAVPLGVIGGRIYHVITSPQGYFGKGGTPIEVFYIWQGGLGIWGAITLGFFAAWWSFNRNNSNGESLPKFATFADALAPGVILAQAIGRWGNWFNIELFGKPTTLPWGLEVPSDFRPAGFTHFATFHPTFLYESIWCVLVAFILLRLEKVRMAPGSIFIAYVALYSFGRTIIESIRIDDANLILGLRLNIWVGLFVSVLSGATLFKRWKSRIKG